MAGGEVGGREAGGGGEVVGRRQWEGNLQKNGEYFSEQEGRKDHALSAELAADWQTMKLNVSKKPQTPEYSAAPTNRFCSWI